MTEFKTKRRPVQPSRTVEGRRRRSRRRRRLAVDHAVRDGLVRRAELHGLGRLRRLPEGVRGVREEDRHQGELHRLRQPGRDARRGQGRRRRERLRSTSSSPPPTASRTGSRTTSCSPGTTRRPTSTASSPAFLQGGAAAQAVHQGKRYGLTSVWGSEALTFNTKEAPLAFGTASLMDLFDDKYAGKLTLRAHSGLVAAGRALEAAGKLPHKFNDSFVDEAKMTANYDAILKFVLPSARTSPSSGRTRTRPRARSAPMAASSALLGHLGLRADEGRLPHRLHRAQGGHGVLAAELLI